MTGVKAVTIVDVGPRDGFQPIGPFIPTDQKLTTIRQLHAAGLRRIEATAFVSDVAVPQLADAATIVQATQDLDGLEVQVLVPNLRHTERALAAGATRLAFVLSVSEKHNMNNVRRTPLDSVAEYARICAMLPEGVAMRINLATAFDCPFDGPVDPAEALDIIARVAAIKPDAELCLCDTTGRVTPDRVAALLGTARSRHPEVAQWAFHGHDTYGLGVANVIAATTAGLTVIDASVAGLGGCPFAPGATGNVATEDVVWTLERMGISTGIDLMALIAVAGEAAKLPGATAGGRVRDALVATLCRQEA
ncbi:hydroxymethylglutaryl-CoA lyase [Sphingobium sp. CR2-8]|uniref:hydroxymethylglutaryl-CoA lyase n=1 Tax=Sphingobium sp. CR2-8 TaxID=1306534 RepID=UPI002DB7B6C8|nr:hydroxymethylglutaryl-CoA lyase [Sphingobium sp. CR2-8]MEC3911898.1 hydroxymethylglutaryl-CoA lyase [Sphingobium sp. CR2-8]